MTPQRRRPGAQHPGTVNKSTGEGLNTAKCTQPMGCTATYWFAAEVEPRANAVASILAALVLGHLERDELLEFEVARLAEAAHRHLVIAGEAS